MIGNLVIADRGLRIADPARGLQPVHLGHLHVHQHQVVGQGLERLDGFRAVGHGVRAQAQLLQDAQGHLLVGDVVLGQQDARPRPGAVSRIAWRVTMGCGRPRPRPHRPAPAARQSKSSDCRTGLVR